MTDQASVSIIAHGNDKYKVTLLEQESILKDQEEVDNMVKIIHNRGYYPYVTDPYRKLTGLPLSLQLTSPFSLTAILRGIEQSIIDLYRDPDLQEISLMPWSITFSLRGSFFISHIFPLAAVFFGQMPPHPFPS